MSETTFTTPTNPDEFLPKLVDYVRDRFRWARDEESFKVLRDEIQRCLRLGVEAYKLGVDDNFWTITLRKNQLGTFAGTTIIPMPLDGVQHRVAPYAPDEGEKDDGQGGFVALETTLGRFVRAPSWLEALVGLAKLVRIGAPRG